MTTKYVGYRKKEKPHRLNGLNVQYHPNRFCMRLSVKRGGSLYTLVYLSARLFNNTNLCHNKLMLLKVNTCDVSRIAAGQHCYMDGSVAYEWAANQ